jgi:23S rRNA (guanosine2251-2'-O)-methyltransferase
MQQLVARAEAAGVRITIADPARLQRLAAGSTHQGVVALCRETAVARSLDDLLATVGAGTLLLLLDGVTDPRNLGACMRTAEAAGAQALIVPRDRSASLTPVVAAAAAGAAETLPLVAVTNLARAMEEIREAGVWVVGAAGEAQQTIYEIDLTVPLAWALGAEGQGLRRLTREKCDWLARIPLHGQTDSLNVSVATGVCLFETQRQRQAKSAA